MKDERGFDCSEVGAITGAAVHSSAISKVHTNDVSVRRGDSLPSGILCGEASNHQENDDQRRAYGSHTASIANMRKKARLPACGIRVELLPWLLESEDCCHPSIRSMSRR
jgi:hypothetical protein